MAAKKLPALMFYVGDWMKDPAVRSVSVAARGLWIDVLCLMFESPRRGYLELASGKPYSLEQVARMTGCSTDEVSRLFLELEDSGVFSRTEHGTVYNRRMVKDEGRRAKDRKRKAVSREKAKKRDVTGGVTPRSRTLSHPCPQYEVEDESNSSEGASKLPARIDTESVRTAYGGYVAMRVEKEYGEPTFAEEQAIFSQLLKFPDIAAEWLTSETARGRKNLRAETVNEIRSARNGHVKPPANSAAAKEQRNADAFSQVFGIDSAGTSEPLLDEAHG